MLKILFAILLLVGGAIVGSYLGASFPINIAWAIVAGITVFLGGYAFGKKTTKE